MKNRSFHILFPILFMIAVGMGFTQALEKQMLQSNGNPVPRPTSNTINDILIAVNDVWIATGEGLIRTTDNGNSWVSYTHLDGLGRGGVSALAQRNDTLWVATAYDTTTLLDTYPMGGGLAFTADQGKNWHWIDQPKDAEDETRYTPMTTNRQNLTYDIALTDSAVWIASFLGGLRKSTDSGKTWEVVTVDGYPFNPQGPFSHQVFSVLYDGQALWVGTAGGIHKSTDRGKNWVTYNHQNQPETISGNFVVAIGHQKAEERNIIWAATIEAVDTTEYNAVSKTEDGGLTWSVVLEGVFAHNFAFDSLNSAVYVATDQGLYKSVDFGDTWAFFPPFVDVETGEGIYTLDILSAGVGLDGTLWVGSRDGLVRSLDNGATWKIYRAFQTPGENGTPRTYAYPNPFSPLQHNQIGESGYVRFQYKLLHSAQVTVRVYDFGMNLVKTVVEGKNRYNPGDYSEVWDGRNELGDRVANGVYFYQIVLTGEDPLWGKVMVVN